MAKQKPFTLVDFRAEMCRLKRPSLLVQVMSYIPGMRKLATKMSLDVDAERDLQQVLGIIDSMTPDERANPSLIELSRRRRIAGGCGADESEVRKPLKEFMTMAEMMELLAGMRILVRMRHIRSIAKSGRFRSNRGPRL